MISGEIRNLIYQLLSSSIGTVTNNLDKKHSCSLLLVCSGTLGEYGDHFYATQREWRIMTPRVERGELHAPLMVQYLLSLPNIITFCIRRASPPSGEKLDNIITAYNATEKFPHYSRSKIQFETHFMIHCEPAISLYNRIGEMLGCIISNKPFATVVIDTTQMLCSDGCCPLLKALEMGSGWGKIRDMVGLRKRSILLRGAEGTRPRFSDSYWYNIFEHYFRSRLQQAQVRLWF